MKCKETWQGLTHSQSPEKGTWELSSGNQVFRPTVLCKAVNCFDFFFFPLISHRNWED